MPVSEVRTDDILERFESAERHGGGGQKVVFLVRDGVLGQVIAKIGKYASTQALERARREVWVLTMIGSPYFPRQHAFEVIDDSRYLMIEEFIDGTTLDAHFTDYRNEEALVGLTYEIVQGMMALWERRIVHRDLKPGNIIISAFGPRIIDLGIARLLDATSLTRSQDPIGPCTPPYASPEQLRNHKRDIDHRSDQFSLGIVLAQLVLAGKHPFDPRVLGEGDHVTQNISRGRWAEEAVGKLVSPGFNEFLHRLLAREPYLRYRLPSEVVASVLQLQKGIR